MNRMRLLAYPLMFAMVMGIGLVGCKKKNKNTNKPSTLTKAPKTLSANALKSALGGKKCDPKNSNDSLSIPDAGELYNLVKGMGVGEKLQASLQKSPLKLDTAKGEVTAYVLGLALAEQTLTLSPKNLDKALPQVKSIYAKAKAANLLDKGSQKQVEKLLKKLEKVKKTKEFRSFLSLVRAEFLKRMREPKHRYNAMLVLAGGLVLSYHEISKAAAGNAKAQSQVGEIFSFVDPVQMLATELGTCFAKQTQASESLKTVVGALKSLEKLLSGHKGKFESKTFQSISNITGGALKSFR